MLCSCVPASNFVGRYRFALFLCLVGGLSLIVGRSEGQITRVGDKYRFKVHYTAGKKLRYVVKNISTPPTTKTSTIPLGKITPLVSIIPQQIEVVSVKGEIATLKVTVGPVTVDNKVEPNSEQTAQLQVDSHNRAVNAKPGGPIGAGLPDKPISVGGSYEIEQTVQRNGGPIKIKQKYTFRGIKTVDGQQVAQLDSVTNTVSFVTTNSTNTIYLLVSDGTLYSTHSHTKTKRQEGNITTSNTSEVIITRTL